MAEELTPKTIVDELDKYIVGQKNAKKAVAVALRNRWRRLQLPAKIQEDITPKNIGKGYALNYLSNFLNVDTNDIMAIGDNVNDIDIEDFLALENNGNVEVNSSGSNRPLFSAPNSYYSTGNGEHIFVYDSNGKLIYDVSNARVKGFKINVDPNGIEYFQPYKLKGSVPNEIKKLFGW